MILSIPFSQKGKLLIKPGQKVDFNTSLLKENKRNEIKIQIARKLHIHPSKIFQSLKKVVGDQVVKGELIAEKKSFFSGKKYKSEYDGIIKEVDHVEGLLVLEIDSSEENERKSFFKGRVEEVNKDEIKLVVEKVKEFEGVNASSFFGGEVFYLKNEYEICEDQVDGKIVVCESLSGINQIKIEALGAIGFVTQFKLHSTIDTPSVQIKEIDSWKEIFHRHLPYCFVDKRKNKVVFYE